MWQQLVKMNPNIPYVGGLCEGYVEGSVGQATKPYRDSDGNWTTSGVYPSATASWNANQGNHPNEPAPVGFDAPIYFSLGNNPDGHVAIALADGRVASSSLPGYHQEGGFIYENIQALIDDYAKYNGGCTYLGWKEYVGNLQVIKMEETMTQDAIEKLVSMSYRAATDTDPTPGQAGYWVGRIRDDNNRAYELSAALGGATYQNEPVFREKARNYDADVAAAYNKGKADATPAVVPVAPVVTPTPVEVPVVPVAPVVKSDPWTVIWDFIKAVIGVK